MLPLLKLLLLPLQQLKRSSILLFTLLILSFAPLTSHAVVPAICNGRIFNPVTDTDWNNIFPITVMGMRYSTGSGSTAPLMDMMPPICVCPTYLMGMPFFGIGVTYWEPSYISEIERRPGCLSSLGGISILPQYSMLASEQAQSSPNGSKTTSRMQVHWYEYPIMSLIDYFADLICRTPSGVALAYLTELDPYWQNDILASIASPEDVLFANPVAQFACSIDAVSSTLGYPLDPLFWCAGAWGSVYPMSGNSSIAGDPFTTNNQIQAKFLARNHRVGVMFQTIGPSAICFSHINPIWVKSQYRYNQVAPIPRYGRAITTGDYGRALTFPPVTNIPSQEHSINLIWQGQQCCVRF